MRLSYLGAGVFAIPVLLVGSLAFAQQPQPPMNVGDEPPEVAAQPEGGEEPAEAPAEPPAAVTPTEAAPVAPPQPPVAQPAAPPPGADVRGAASWPGASHTAVDADQKTTDKGPKRDMSRDFWQGTLGVRTSWVSHEGLNPFASNDHLTHASLGGTRTLFMFGDMSLAAGLLWEFTTRRGEARGAESELNVQRLGAVAEGRYHLGRDVYALIKLVPQGMYTAATLKDSSAPADLQQKTWRFGLDATAGAAWNIPRSIGAISTTPEFWLMGEFGYGWAMSRDLKLSPDVDSDDPQADMELNLGPFAPRGVMMRVAVAMTF